MCFAPTRSGKGVGLVLPTLLSWTSSAVVHDIKGENWELTAGWRSTLLALPVVQSDRLEKRPLQSAARGAQRGGRSPRCPEHRRHPGRSRRGARTPNPLGKDQPFAPGRRHSSRPLCGREEDAHPRHRDPGRSCAVLREDAQDHDGNQPSWHRGRAEGPPRRRRDRARAPQQVRKRALRRAVDGRELPRALPRSRSSAETPKAAIGASPTS